MIDLVVCEENRECHGMFGRRGPISNVTTTKILINSRYTMAMGNSIFCFHFDYVHLNLFG